MGDTELARVFRIFLYGITAFCLGAYLEFVGGSAAKPIIHFRAPFYLALGAILLFVIACGLAIIGIRYAQICALIGSIMTWPQLALALSTLAWWSDPTWFVRYRAETLAALISVLITTIYSGYSMRRVFCRAS